MRVLLLWVLAGVLGCASAPPRADFSQQIDGQEEGTGVAAFERAHRLNTVVGYKHFLDAFPEAAQAGQARALLEGLRFDAAKAVNSSEAWRRFLQDHPNGAHATQAQRFFDDAQFREVARSETDGRLSRVVADHPDDPRSTELANLGDDRAFEAATQAGALGLFRYLREYPSGRHRGMAERQLFDLHIDRLLFSGSIEKAREEISSASNREGSAERFSKLKTAERQLGVMRENRPAIRELLGQGSSRKLADLLESLDAADALERWEAADELGQHVSFEALDPLLRVFQSARNAWVRQKAFDSIRALFAAFPKPLADYEMAMRLEGLREKVAGPQLHLVSAVLLDAGGRTEEAVSEYVQAFDANQPDPVVLRRWASLRLAEGKVFSAAVASRQLAGWAEEASQMGTSQGPVSLATVRAICAAHRQIDFADAVIAQAKGGKIEFPEDVERFQVKVREARQKVEARLAAAEARLRAEVPSARSCADHSFEARLTAGAAKRLRTLRALSMKERWAMDLVRLVSRKDPSAEVRALATTRLASVEKVGESAKGEEASAKNR